MMPPLLQLASLLHVKKLNRYDVHHAKSNLCCESVLFFYAISFFILYIYFV